MFIGRPASVIKSKTHLLGLGSAPHPQWTVEEEELLVTLQSSCTSREIAAFLGRSRAAVGLRKRQLGMTNGPSASWSQAEQNLLAELKAVATHKEIAQMLGRSVYAVSSATGRAGLSKPCGRKRPWTDAETELARSMEAELTHPEIAALLCRTWRSVAARLQASKLRDLKRRDWTAQENAVLRHSWPTRPAKEVAEMIGRSEAAVALHANVLGVKKDPGYLVSIGRTYWIYPPELREAMTLRKQLRKVLKDAKHQHRA